MLSLGVENVGMAGAKNILHNKMNYIESCLSVRWSIQCCKVFKYLYIAREEWGCVCVWGGGGGGGGREGEGVVVRGMIRQEYFFGKLIM